MTDKFFAESLYDNGYLDLVSVIPPGAQLVPSSSISHTQLGKVPGRKSPSGLWAGYDWRRFAPSVDDVRQWCLDGANIGVRADRFPGVDIDCMDDRIASIVEQAALAKLGPAPVRIGRAPKRLLMYRTTEPFARMRLFIKLADGEQHLVEILGEGQQYLIHGTHPTTLRPYAWSRDLTTQHEEDELTTITREQAVAFLDELEQILDVLSLGVVEREGDGRRKQATARGADQSGLLAPSLELLSEAVRLIPNTDALFPQRDDYIKMGAAVRAASGDEIEGFEIFAEWCSRHERDGRVVGNPDTWLGDWRRLKPPFSLGWNWIAELARGFGFVDAHLDFDVVEGATAPSDRVDVIEAPLHSDQWLADEIVRRQKGMLRYAPERGDYLVWTESRWKHDPSLLAEDIIKRELRRIADMVLRRASNDKEIKEAQKLGQQICSAAKASAVAQLIRSDRSIAVSVSSLDHDIWKLNTPAGIVDLKTGKLNPPEPDELCTKTTAVQPDFGGACPEWRRFLAEATGGNVELEKYLQRFAGYALTGCTDEQQLTFIFGGGENGKSVFLNAIGGILGEYSTVADMNTFTASANDKHTTDLAMLMGSRLVRASETEQGKRWDTARLKNMTGGEPITARFMRQDNFTYLPQFKLLFVGNHKPETRDVGHAMQRRIHMVPFEVTPARRDPRLGAKLREEWPAILAWMIEGCLAWQEQGLNPPQIVRDKTEEYFKSEDAVGRWLEDRCVIGGGERAGSTELFQSWREWANENGEYVGSQKRLTQALLGRKFERWQDSTTRRRGFAGVGIIDRQGAEFLG